MSSLGGLAVRDEGRRELAPEPPSPPKVEAEGGSRLDREASRESNKQAHK